MFKHHYSLRSLLALAMLAIADMAAAHHGTSVSYDMQHILYMDAVLVQYAFTNPHPRMSFDRVNEKGEVERWECEGAGNPSMLIRWGWSRSEILRALQGGAKIKVGVARSRENPTSGIVLEVFDATGKPILLAKPKERATDYPGPGLRDYAGPG